MSVEIRSRWKEKKKKSRENLDMKNGVFYSRRVAHFFPFLIQKFLTAAQHQSESRRVKKFHTSFKEQISCNILSESIEQWEITLVTCRHRHRLPPIMKCQCKFNHRRIVSRLHEMNIAYVYEK